MRKIILDTDIGTDVDDALALSLAVKSPEIDLIAVTTVYGDVNLRARMARKLLRLAGREDVPVAMGVRQPLLRNRAVYWAGHEGQGLLGPEDAALPVDRRHAVDVIVETVLASKGEITLVPIGPLTNIATALTREPSVAEHVREIVLMGGVVRAADSLRLPWVEHNIRCDPEAASIVLRCGAPITMVPLDVTTRVVVDRAGVERIEAVGTPFALAVADQVRRHPRFRERGATYTHDPLAVAMVVDRSFCTVEAMQVDVETKGEFTAGATVARLAGEGTGNAQVCVAVDAPRFQEFLVSRLAS